MSQTGPAFLTVEPPALYVYVIELRGEVWGEPRFREKNKRAANRVARGEPVTAVYVGSSTHRAACRLEIHRGSRSCSCGVQPQGSVRYGMSSPWVERFGERVVSEALVDGLGHAVGVRAARALASTLRQAGFGVWQVP